MTPFQLPSGLHQAGSEFEYVEPASGTAISVTKWGDFVFATGASGETNTLAAPTTSGQRIKLFCRSHGGGNRVITVASAINKAGNTVLTFAATGDFVVLESVRSAPSTYVWRITTNDGVTPS